MTEPPRPEGPRESVHRNVPKADGRSAFYSWPSRDDYVEMYCRSGQLESPDEFNDAFGLHSMTVLDWLARNQTGCLFAARLSRLVLAGRAQSEWALATVSKDLTPADAAAQVDDELADALEWAELLQVSFPGRETLDEIIDLIAALCQRPDWYWDEIESKDPLTVNVGLRWRHPSGQHVAWIVGFCPIDGMPFTRQAPLTTLAIRTQLDKRSTYDPDDLPIPIHLADLDDELTSAEVRDAFTQKTKQLKSAFTEAHTVSSARARVTFSIPRSDLTRLPAPATQPA